IYRLGVGEKMSITVKDVLQLDVMKNFKVIAGEGGLNRPVQETEILDFEFAENVDSERAKIFNGKSVMLSSLLFAKDKPELILDAVKKLDSLHVSCLAYKPVIFKELPYEVLEYANRVNFPIMKFGDDEFFEDVILSVREQIEKEGHLSEIERYISDMIGRDMPLDEIAVMREKISPWFKENIVAACVQCEGETEDDIRRTVKNTAMMEKLQGRAAVSKFRNNYMIMMSEEDADRAKVKVLLEDILITYGINDKKKTIGYSKINRTADGFASSLRQAYCSVIVAKVKGVEMVMYKDIGIYKMIVPQMYAQGTVAFLNDYLAPLIADDEKDGGLLQTAIEYIKAKGDMVQTADKLFCHKNTIRYRVGKIQEKVDPESNEKEFYENLSVAIKIYLLQQEVQH
ncbi:MAG TPA: PucR family transcriptional regulator ligand-binding domain-containing protein, partial [Anaerovoracaceae bacterium]|nr:PucR family transcriptional regulator ligand-binding domain-containing protein [Anaerovoracaceae bacterium]